MADCRAVRIAHHSMDQRRERAIFRFIKSLPGSGSIAEKLVVTMNCAEFIPINCASITRENCLHVWTGLRPTQRQTGPCYGPVRHLERPPLDAVAPATPAANCQMVPRTFNIFQSKNRT